MARASVAEEELHDHADDTRVQGAAVDRQYGVIKRRAASREEAVRNENHVSAANQVNLSSGGCASQVKRCFII